MANKKHSRKIIMIAGALVLFAGLTFAFWPQPTLVDMDSVKRGQMLLTIDEEARTRVHDTFIVSAPVSGRLLRVDAEPGDLVEKGKTVVARMRPTSPPVLDAREKEKALAEVQAAEANLRSAKANMRNVVADQSLADSRFARVKEQLAIKTVSQADFEQARRELDSSLAAIDNAEAEISLREAQLANARATFTSMDESNQEIAETIHIKAPISGSILKIEQESEVSLASGTPIMEIGNIDNDLEVLVELLSTDAIQVRKGDRVIIDNWGGSQPLSGEVKRIDPLAFTKFSALGVEEQRVNAIISLAESSGDRTGLGDGFRVEVQIVIWESDDAVIVPASALFRKDGDWAVYRVEGDSANLTMVEIEHNNGIQANVVEGLQVDDRVILYPAAELADGANVESRQ